MKLSQAIVTATLLTEVSAQTPPGFNVTTSQSLTVVVQPSNITITSSQLISQQESLYTPWIYKPTNADSNGIYLLVMLDSALPVLQWMQPNLVVGSGGNLTVDVTAKNASSAVGAPYVYPQPPVGQMHEYIYLLYKQPNNWVIPTNYSLINPPASIPARLNFQIADFQRSAMLGDPIAANYMRTLNGTSAQSSGLVSATQTALTIGSGTATAATTQSGTTSASASATTSASGAVMKMLQNEYRVVGIAALIAEVVSWLF